LLTQTAGELTTKIQDDPTSFTSKFDSVYAPKSPFFGQGYSVFSQSLLSNLLGGIGYFYGNSRYDTSSSPAYQENDVDFWEEAATARVRITPELKGPFELFTSVPSRPFFPRGFLWDEGFHLQVVLDWDMDLALNVVKSWFALMDENGWIAREQILGPEARSKVPPEFQVQYPHYANPPTLFLVLTAFVDRLTDIVPYSGTPSLYLQDPQAGRQYLHDLYPLLKRHYYWFRRTQSGQLGPDVRPNVSATEGYRWRGRTPQHTLTSGLDDYPRAQPPHPGELHIDAISWVGSMAGSLHKLSKLLGVAEDQFLFAEHEQAIKNSIEELHWSDEHEAYCDATIENENHVLVCHKGYISLFPFLLGLLETHNPHLEAVLDLIRSEGELWSPYGLRSLSHASPLYGSGENYWRSPIWVNINYLVIEQLLVSVVSLIQYFRWPFIPFVDLATMHFFGISTHVVPGISAVSWSVSTKSTHNIHRASAELGLNSVQLLAFYWICVGAIQP
jgi:mannosyl-oligosaccharide glucosidase